MDHGFGTAYTHDSINLEERLFEVEKPIFQRLSSAFLAAEIFFNDRSPITIVVTGLLFFFIGNTLPNKQPYFWKHFKCRIIKYILMVLRRDQVLDKIDVRSDRDQRPVCAEQQLIV